MRSNPQVKQRKVEFGAEGATHLGLGFLLVPMQKPRLPGFQNLEVRGTPNAKKTWSRGVEHGFEPGSDLLELSLSLLNFHTILNTYLLLHVFLTFSAGFGTGCEYTKGDVNTKMLIQRIEHEELNTKI